MPYSNQQFVIHKFTEKEPPNNNKISFLVKY